MPNTTSTTTPQEIGAILNFLHNFPRFASTPDHFAPYDAHYQQYLQFLVTLTCAIGFGVFLSMLVLLIRRWKFAQVDAFAFKYAFSADIPAVLLLGVTALSALAGLLGQAKIDFAVHQTQGAIYNSTRTFMTLQDRGTLMQQAILSVDASSDDLLSAYGSKLPAEAAQLVQATTQLRHVSNDLHTVLDTLPSEVLRQRGMIWDHAYNWLKGSTNTVIAGISIASLIGIVSIGWSLPSAIRWSLLITLWTIPMAHTLVGLYLAGAIGGADFCLNPAGNTLQVFNPSNTTQSMMEYYIYCNGTSSVFTSELETLRSSRRPTPFSKSLDQVDRLSQLSKKYVVDLSDFAEKHPNLTKKMQQDYLNPMHAQLSDIRHQLDHLDKTSTCSSVHAAYQDAMTSFCDHGVVGAFSLWIHQMALCLLLLVCVICTATVWEGAEARDVRMERQYSLLSTYEEDDVDHVYLTPE